MTSLQPLGGAPPKGPILVTGGTGLVGGAIARHLREAGLPVLSPGRGELDLLDARATEAYLERHAPTWVIAAAALVGGIQANIRNPVRFLVENIQMQTSLMLASARAGVGLLVFLGSSCIYPRDCPQPMNEESYLGGPLEPTNESYAVAKIAGIRLAQALMHEGRLRVIVPIPSNIYGPRDTFDLERAHVVSSLVRRFVDARDDGLEEVVVWGTGSARRELTHVDDVARAVMFLAGLDDPPFLVNVGTGVDVTIRELTTMVAGVVGYAGTIRFDATKPDGMPRKVVDTARIESLGWGARIPLERGLLEVVAAYEALKRGGPGDPRTRLGLPQV